MLQESPINQHSSVIAGVVMLLNTEQFLILKLGLRYSILRNYQSAVIACQGLGRRESASNSSVLTKVVTAYQKSLGVQDFKGSALRHGTSDNISSSHCSTAGRSCAGACLSSQEPLCGAAFSKGKPQVFFQGVLLGSGWMGLSIEAKGWYVLL